MDSVGSGGFWPDVEATTGGKRVLGRDSLFLLATLRIASEAAVAPVRVRNLSPGGLMAEYDRPLPIDMPVSLDLRGIGTVSGRVAWSAEGRIGIAFDRPVDPQKARKPVGGGGRTPDYAKPKLVR